MDEQPNVEEEESSTKTLQSDFVSDYAHVLDDSSSLVEPVSPIAAKIDDTVVLEAETVDEPLAAAEEDFSGDAKLSELEVLGVGAETLVVGKEDELDGGASGSEVVGVGAAVEGVELEDVSELEALLPCSGSVEEEDKEVEAQGRGELVAVVESVVTEDERTDVEAKVEDDENGAEVVEEVLNFGVKRESEEPIEDSLPVDTGNGGIEAVVEQEKDEVKANDEVEEDEIKAATEVDEDEVKATEEVENDDIKATEEVKKDEIKATEEVGSEKDEVEAMQDEGDEIKAMEEEIEGHEIKTMEEEVEKDEVEAMEQVEKDETEAMEEVEKGDGEGESIMVEDDLDLVSIKKDGKGESVAADNDEDETLAAAEDVPEVEMETPESAKSTGGGKRKRGKNFKGSTTRSPAARKTIEEDVCFICFDGGDLVLCDRR